MGRYSRRGVYATASGAWSAVIWGTLAHAEIRIYMTLWLFAFLASLACLAIWLIRPDHGMLAHVRLALAAMKVDGAVAEREAREVGVRPTPPHGARAPYVA